jgi:hypothetical protein
MILEKLHYVTGEVCTKLGFIDCYPPFNPVLQPEPSTISNAPTTGEPEVDEALIQRITKLMRNRMKSAAFAKTDKQMIDVHVSPAARAQKLPQHKTKNTDSGANGKAAYQHLAKYIADSLPDVQILMDNVKSELIMIKNNKETVLVIKTGCTCLGSKDSQEQWQLLPGVDYVLYAPTVIPEIPLQEQFRLFERETFVKFWEDLGLLRYKVSTAMRKRIVDRFGPDEKITTDKHADVVSIQSFTNSGKKYPMVMQGLSQYPLLADTDLNTVL